LFRPVGRVNEALREQHNVESKFGRVRVDRFLFRRKQIKKQRRQSGFVERTGNELIPGAVPATTASVDEKNDGGRSINNR